MLTKAIRSVVSGILFAVGFVLGKVVLRSLGDAMKYWGTIGTVLFILFVSGVSMGLYSVYGLETSIYSVISILIIHVSLWGVGFFNV